MFTWSTNEETIINDLPQWSKGQIILIMENSRLYVTLTCNHYAWRFFFFEIWNNETLTNECLYRYIYTSLKHLQQLPKENHSVTDLISFLLFFHMHVSYQNSSLNKLNLHVGFLDDNTFSSLPYLRTVLIIQNCT